MHRRRLYLLVLVFSILFAAPVMAGNYIFMGDSYSSGNYSWPEIIAERLNIPSSNIGLSKNAGAGFAQKVNSYYLNLSRRDNYPNHINTLYQKSKDWNRNVTRIFIEGGVLNDYLKAGGPATQSELWKAMKQLDTELKKRYPNAKILYASTNWCVPSKVKAEKPKVISALAGTNLYIQYAQRLGWYHMRNAEYALRLSAATLPKYFNSDGIHPNINGKKLIANGMITDLKQFEAQIKKKPAERTLTKIPITRMNVKSCTETTITLNINSVPQGVRYVLYGGKVGEKFKKIDTLYTTETVRKKLRKGTYYNYQVISYNASGLEIARSRRLYVATKGGKYTNACDVTVPKTYVSLKKGAAYKVVPTKVLREKEKTEKIFREYVYLSDIPGIASISESGTITAHYPGRATIMVIAQSGARRNILVNVY